MLSKKPWRAEAVLFFCAAQVFCLLLGMILAGVFGKLAIAGFKTPEDFGNPLIATLSFQGATWILIPIFLRFHHMNVREAFGLKKSEWQTPALLAVATVAIVLPMAFGLEWFSLFALKKIHWKLHEEEAVTLVAGAKAVWMKIYLDFFAVALAPVAEEFIFRGILYPVIKQIGHPRLALFGVSALFALIHMDAAIALPLFVLALALTLLYEATDNLLAPILAHGLFNAANLILLVLLSCAR